MAKLLYAASAENDLLAAWLYVAEDSVAAADRMLMVIILKRPAQQISG